MKKFIFILSMLITQIVMGATVFPIPNVQITGGTIDGAPVGLTAPRSASFTSISGNGLTSLTDSGRSGNDNTPSINVSISEALNYTSSYATHYGFILNANQTGGTGDRIGIGAIQTCSATLSGKSCVGLSGLAVPSGSTQGNFTGINSRVLVPAGLTGPIGAAVAFEADVETHSPVLIRNGFRVAGENMSGGTTTHGYVEDAGIALVNDSGNNSDGFQIGLLFGEAAQGYPSRWPILPGGTYWQAYSPTIQAAYGLDWTGSTAGWSKYAIALPQNTTGADIAWGTAGTAGIIGSTATTNGGAMVFTDNGIAFNNPSGGSLLNVGGSTGADVVNNGYMTQASLTGYVQCNGSAGRCTATNSPTFNSASTSSLSVTNGSDVITAQNNANNVLVFSGTGSSTAKSLATLNMGGHIASYDSNVGDGVAFKSDYYNTAVFQGLNSSGTSGYDTNVTLYRPSSTNNAFLGVTMSPSPSSEQHLWLGTDYANSRYVFTQTVTGTGSYLPVVFGNGQGTAFTLGTGTTPTTTFVGGGVVLGGGEGNQLTWSLGGQIWSTNMASGGNWYLHDGTNNKFPIAVAPNTSATLTMSGSKSTFSGSVTLSNGITLPVTTVSSLPTCDSAQKGMMYSVSDATSPTYNGALTGGGSIAIPVFCNGSSWTAH